MDFVRYCQYLEWAEARVAELIEKLSDTEFTKKHTSLGKSIRNLVEHLWMSIEIFKLQLSKKEAGNINEEASKISRQELMERWHKAPSQLASVLQGEHLDGIDVDLGDGRIVTFGMEDWFLSYCDHSVYHRGQMISLLKLLGHKGVNTDYGTFVVETA